MNDEIQIPEDFLFAMNQCVINNIMDNIKSAIIESQDNGTFTIEQAKQFVIYAVSDIPESEIIKYKEWLKAMELMYGKDI